MKPTLAEKALAYARLLRLSNGPTAVADVWMGYAVVAGELKPTQPLVLMTCVSLCLYQGGMVMNDVADVERDATEHRGRPIELGLVRYATAQMLAQALTLCGLLVAFVAAATTDSVSPLVVAILLSAAIAAYNLRYKATIAGPLLMGLCRLLNVELGLQAAANVRVATSDLGKAPIEAVEGFEAALLVGTYIVGVTWFARDEATGQGRRQLGLAFCVCVMSIAHAAFTLWRPPNLANPIWWYTIWAIVALIATRGMVAAIFQPTPRNVGRGVGIAIQGLVVIDATLAGLYAGPMAGLAILALLPVTMLLARWIPQT